MGVKPLELTVQSFTANHDMYDGIELELSGYDARTVLWEIRNSLPAEEWLKLLGEFWGREVDAAVQAGDSSRLLLLAPRVKKAAGQQPATETEKLWGKELVDAVLQSPLASVFDRSPMFHTAFGWDKGGEEGTASTATVLKRGQAPSTETDDPPAPARKVCHAPPTLPSWCCGRNPCVYT